MAKYNNIRYKPKFDNAKDIEDTLVRYFEECDENGEPYSVTGLALALGTSRKVLLDYEHCMDDLENRNNKLKSLDDETKLEISNTIKRAKAICENYNEIKLLDPSISKSPIGYIFALKNFGWVDKQEIVNTDKKALEDMTEDELNRRLEELKK